MKRSVWAIGHVLRISSQSGNGSLTQTGSRWSKSLAQSFTDGRWLMASTLGVKDFDGKLGAVGLGKIGLLFQPRGHGAVALLARVAVLVELEQLGRQRLAAVVTLAFVAIDAHLERAGVGHVASLLLPWALSLAVWVSAPR